MNGQELYALYIQAHLERNCSVDPWESLEPVDQETWERIAVLNDETDFRLRKLAALEAGGVDNWEWYDDAMEKLDEELSKGVGK